MTDLSRIESELELIKMQLKRIADALEALVG
jgi:hypothetical protein